jgi:hypothetical protein
MLLLELFPDDNDDSTPDGGGKMQQQLRQAALDLITPLLGQNVPFITMQQVIDGLSGARFGIVITPAIIMDILNPDDVKAIDKIEGDRIYLSKPGAESGDREVAQDQQEQDKERVGDMATNQINQELKK